MEAFQAELERLRDAGQYRSRQTLDTPQGPEVVIDGQERLSFCSNDYLGLANHPRVVEALRSGAERYGVGSGAAHLVCGHGRAHAALEEELAEFVARPRALLFSTGYMANLGVVTALAGAGDAVFEDRLNHASLIDAGLLSGARLRRYGHADPAALERLLARRSGNQRLIVTDGVFSMDGDLAPLKELARLAEGYGARLVVDDAHGLGVLGPEGRGTVAQHGLGMHEVPLLIGTLGKAFGTFGAFVAGSEELVEYLIQRARPYIYTTALPPAIAEATRTSLQLVREQSWRRAHLAALVDRFRRGALERGLDLAPSHSPIQPLLLGSSSRALAWSQSLDRQGILIRAIRPPTVPQGSARLRITFSAAHSAQHIDRLLDALAATGRELEATR
jgi:8-amino-7-oxononanoate synthase